MIVLLLLHVVRVDVSKMVSWDLGWHHHWGCQKRPIKREASTDPKIVESSGSGDFGGQ